MPLRQATTRNEEQQQDEELDQQEEKAGVLQEVRDEIALLFAPRHFSRPHQGRIMSEASMKNPSSFLRVNRIIYICCWSWKAHWSSGCPGVFRKGQSSLEQEFFDQETKKQEPRRRVSQEWTVR
jgi:hypothetical protein